MSFEEHLNKDRRLVILRFLLDMGGYRSNSSVIWAFMHDMGHAVSRDFVKTQIHWLAEQQLVSVTEPVTGVLMASLTERGADVAAGLVATPGVARPSA